MSFQIGSSDPYNLGTLATLPREIRNLIFARLPRNSLNLLLTSRQIYDEALPLIVACSVVEYQLSAVYQHECWRAQKRSLVVDRLRWSGIHLVRVEITPVLSSDPGQIACLLLKVEHLVDFLSQFSAFDRVLGLDIRLRNLGLGACDCDCERGRWADWAKSSFDMGSDARVDGRRRGCFSKLEECSEDYQIILHPFLRLFGLPEVTIAIDGAVDDERTSLLESYEEFIQREGYLEDRARARDRTHCARILDSIDRCWMELDGRLDSLPGPTANMMRLHRFSTWYDDNSSRKHGKSAYTRRLSKLFSRYRVDANSGTAIIQRYHFQRAFNPLSQNMLLMRYHQDGNMNRWESPLTHQWCEDEWTEYCSEKLVKRGLRAEENLVQDFRLRTGWDGEEWQRYYPEGIPALTMETEWLRSSLMHMEPGVGLSVEMDWVRWYEQDYVTGKASVDYRDVFAGS
jgi:hypothetical protein